MVAISILTCLRSLVSHRSKKLRGLTTSSTNRSNLPYHTWSPNVCLIDDIYDYTYVSQDKTTVAFIDDNEELEYTDQTFDIIGFPNDEKWNCFKLTAAVMACGEVKFTQKEGVIKLSQEILHIPRKWLNSWESTAIKSWGLPVSPRSKTVLDGLPRDKLLKMLPMLLVALPELLWSSLQVVDRQV